MILECSGLSFIDSTRLSVLIAAQKRLMARGARLVVRSPRSNVSRVIEITHVREFLNATRDRRGTNGTRSKPVLHLHERPKGCPIRRTSRPLGGSVCTGVQVRLDREHVGQSRYLHEPTCRRRGVEKSQIPVLRLQRQVV